MAPVASPGLPGEADPRRACRKERVAYRVTPRVETLVDEEVAALPEIVFRSGSHHELVAMPYADYARLVKPRVGDFCVHD